MSEMEASQFALERWRGASQPVGMHELLCDAQSLVVIVPHADDETLGCGGLIAAAVDRGLEVSVHVLTDGAASHPHSAAWPAERLRTQRELEVVEAVKSLSNSLASVRCHGFADGALDRAVLLDEALGDVDVVVTCWQDDPHPDHRACFEIARAATDRCSARLLAFPLWVLKTEIAVPDSYRVLRVDVSEYLTRKQAAIALHQSQLGQLIHDDPKGFVLDDQLLSLFVRSDELYVEIS